MPNLDRKPVFTSLKISLGIIALLWAILLLSTIMPFIKNLGIHPRVIMGLVGIITSPFIHDNMSHLIANSTSILILGTIFIATEKERAFYISIPIVLLGGLGTWLIGRSGTNHIGASGIIYGILGYLLTIGIFRRKIGSLLIALVIFILYGGALWGVLPVISGYRVSWEGHLCGFLVGILAAWSESHRRGK